jgi:transposase
MTDLAFEKGRELLDRLLSKVIVEDDYGLLAQIVESHMFVCEALKEKNATIRKLQHMLFGAATEKASTIIPELKRMTNPKKDEMPKGHGRNGASSYTGGTKVTIFHTSLKRGNLCPECRKGKVYPTDAGLTVRISGSTPLQATSFECEKLRCNLCGEVFTAAPDVGPEKYDATSGAMIALLRYGTGVPFKRLERLQDALGIPLPASTQWDIVEKTAMPAHPVYKELIRQAAQGEIVHNDDTTMKVLAPVNEGRKGTFTTGMLSVTGKKKIALFVTGHHHAGENLADLLAQRHGNLNPPIQMCDALSRNVPKEFSTLLANCLAHARRNFVDVAESFPDECRHVIETLAKVYEHDARTQEMSPGGRHAYHEARSGPLMEDLRKWMNTQFDEKRVEPNSGLGKAFSYMLAHWDPLTLFLRVPGAPIDNNAVERVLKMAIRHRRNSLFFRTLHGAYIGDIFMSLIHTCNLSKVNPFDYLVALQKHSHEVFKHPEGWLPWNYTAAIAGAPS